MNARLIRFVAAVASVAVVSVLSGGSANAATADRVTGQASSHAAGTYLKQLHDYLAVAVDRGDVAAVEAAVKHLRPTLDAVGQAPVERAALVLNDRADKQAAQVERDLPGLSLLAPVASLVAALLATVMDLVTSLLGAAPVPMPPLPPVPGTP